MPRPRKISDLAKKAAWAMDHLTGGKKETNIPPKRPWFLEYAILRAGVPLALLVAGPSFIAGGLFKLGVVIFYLGAVLVVVDFRYEGWLQKVRPITRRLLLAIYLLAIVGASWKWIFYPAHFETFASSLVPTYGKGSTIDGIPWLESYPQLSFNIKNSSDLDFDNFDAEISTDLLIADMRMVNGVSDCKLAGTSPPIDWHVQREVGGVPVGPADSQPEKYKVVPLGPDGKPIGPPSGTHWTYRIACNRLLSHSQLDFVSALEVVSEAPPKEGQHLFAPPKTASWISIKSRFSTRGRNREEAFLECPMMRVCESKGSR